MTLLSKYLALYILENKDELEGILDKIDIIDKQYPKKFDPVSPIKVFAGLKLYGKNPHKAPPKAVIKTIDINGEPFNAKIISKDIQEIIEIPVDNPSKPSIKFNALVIPTIQITVIITLNTSQKSLI